MTGDSCKLIMALAACLLGYGEVGLWLKKEASKPDTWVVLEGNPYLKWIEDYSGVDYQAAVQRGLGTFSVVHHLGNQNEYASFLLAETIERIAVADPPSPLRFEEWRSVWEQCTRLEKGFWDMSMNLL